MKSIYVSLGVLTLLVIGAIAGSTIYTALAQQSDSSTGVDVSVKGDDIAAGNNVTRVRFGGVYMRNLNADLSMRSCRYPNPSTNSCSCPPGYTAYKFWEYNDPGHEIWKDGGANLGIVDMFQCYRG